MMAICGGCHDYWADFVDVWPDYKGTMIVPACGDGCCHERVECDECGGTGEVPDDSECAE